MEIVEIALIICAGYVLSVVVLCVIMILSLQDSLEQKRFKGEAEVSSLFMGSLWGILFAPFYLVKYFITRMIRLFTW